MERVVVPLQPVVVVVEQINLAASHRTTRCAAVQRAALRCDALHAARHVRRAGEHWPRGPVPTALTGLCTAHGADPASGGGARRMLPDPALTRWCNVATVRRAAFAR